MGGLIKVQNSFLFAIYMRVCRNLLLALLLASALRQAALAQGDWPVYGGDAANTRSSRLAQINVANVSSLKPAWTWDSGETSVSFETTPLVINHVMFVSTPHERVVALDADTGRQIWAYDPKVDEYSTHRGISYWPGDAQNAARVIAGTTDGRIIALDAGTGAPIATFGKNGVVDFRAEFTAKFEEMWHRPDNLIVQ